MVKAEAVDMVVLCGLGVAGKGLSITLGAGGGSVCVFGPASTLLVFVVLVGVSEGCEPISLEFFGRDVRRGGVVGWTGGEPFFVGKSEYDARGVSFVCRFVGEIVRGSGQVDS